jgi:SnoaL-like domain
MSPYEWIQLYGRAWETADKELTLSLFTDDAVYRSQIFHDPSVGHEAIGAYWERTRDQHDVRVRFGRPIVEQNHAAVEWWTTMLARGRKITVAGCLLLRFAPDGRCEELREYWQRQDGYHEPPPGWGE